MEAETGKKQRVQILGTRGIPACHGGFETFAEQLSLFLVKRDWDVTVYCQLPEGEKNYNDTWRGVHRVHLSARGDTLGTMQFDLAAVREAVKRPGLPLVLGYNTGIFNALFRMNGRKVLTNMDGIEWKRDKWSAPAKAWLWLNEVLTAKLSTHLVADHPSIKQHLMRHSPDKKITTIAYGADHVESAERILLQPFNLTSNRYFIVIARPEPENSILEIVRAYSVRPRQMPLILLGNYMPKENTYHAEVLKAAREECIFLGAIYNKEIIRALRFYARGYIHGHQVGGTNPSLVEALAASTPVIAHDNRFNRWVTGDAGVYFRNQDELEQALDLLSHDTDAFSRLRQAAAARHAKAFTQEKILTAYEDLLKQYI
jgi:glycosyltransferase involved in cell wall biosynthesis